MSISEKYILTVDQSTSASKIMIFNERARLLNRISLAHKQYYPAPGFVEHDPMEIYENVVEGMGKIVKETGIEASGIACLAITNQRETVMMWDKKTGRPVHNAIVWQCQRGAGLCDELKKEGLSEKIREKTGLIIDPYFSASKLRWMMDNIEGLSERADAGDLLLGTMDSWLLWKLTSGKVHATDYSNACRTMLFNINSLEWDPELAALFHLEISMFPEVKYSDEVFGYTDPSVVFGLELPVSGILGDSHAALFGQNCFHPGMSKSTYGTGSSMMMNIGETIQRAPEGLVTSIGYGMNNRIFYVFEGNIHSSGDTVNWLKNELGLISESSETEELAMAVEGNNGVYLVPAFVGLGAPYWDNNARACISGMGRNTNKMHIVRAALESIAYQVKDLVSLIEEEAGIPLLELRADGGPTRNRFLMQFQADILNRNVLVSDIEEISALGVSLMAGLATGIWNDTEEIEKMRGAGKKYMPQMEKKKSGHLYSGWKKAVERARL